MEIKKQTRRERQAEMLRTEILEAAVKSFQKYGYEKATTKKIAEEAEVSEGTLYYYFSNKREILITLFKQLIENLTTNLTQVASANDDITNLLSSGMAHQYQQIDKLPIMTLFLQEARLDPEVREIFLDMMESVRESAALLLQRLGDNGKIKKVDYNNLALLMSLIGIGYMTLFEIGDHDLAKHTVRKLTDSFANVLVSGLSPEQ